MAALVLFCVGVALVGCGESHEASGPRQVVCTVAMVADVVKEVAGDKAAVTSLMGTGVDPHSYRPDRDDIVRLQRADVVFYSGLLLEGKMTDALASLGEGKPVFAVTDAIPRERLLSPEDGHGTYDPHVWMDASLWALTAKKIASDLAAVDPPNAAYYAANAEAYAAKCQQLYEYGQKSLATVPAGQRLLVTSHDAFNYFGRAYGIEVTGVQGISTESEANVKSINALVDLIVARKVKAVFVESSVSQKNVQAIIEGARARGHAVAVGGELFSDAMGAANTYEGTYLGMIDHNVTLVTRALGGDAPTKGWQGKLSE
jgi:manganese/zinc/iron transport system substrate-binding protein